MEMEVVVVVGDCSLAAAEAVSPLAAGVFLLAADVYRPAVGVCSGVVLHSNCRRQRHRLRSIGNVRLVVAEAGGRRRT